MLVSGINKVNLIFSSLLILLVITMFFVKNDCVDPNEVSCRIEGQTLTNLNLPQTSDLNPQFLWQSRFAKVKIITLVLLIYPLLLSLIVNWLLGIEIFYTALGLLAVAQLSRYALLSLITLAFLTSILFVVTIIRYFTDRNKKFGTLTLKGSSFTLIAIFFPIGFLVSWDLSRSNHFPPLSLEPNAVLFYMITSSIVCIYVLAMVAVGLSLTKESEDKFSLRAYGIKVKSITKEQVNQKDGFADISFLGKNRFRIIK